MKWFPSTESIPKWESVHGHNIIFSLIPSKPSVQHVIYMSDLKLKSSKVICFGISYDMKNVSGKDAQSFETLWPVNGCACNSLLYSKSHSQSRKQIYRSPWVNIHNIYIYPKSSPLNKAPVLRSHYCIIYMRVTLYIYGIPMVVQCMTRPTLHLSYIHLFFMSMDS